LTKLSDKDVVVQSLREAIQTAGPLSGFPKCPNCKAEVLIPFSSPGHWGGSGYTKTFAHWVCVNCGFDMGTGDRSAVNLEKDLEVGISEKILEKVRKAVKK